MQTFIYPFYVRIIYRYGNIAATILLLLYLIPIVIGIGENRYLLIPLAASLFLIYFINKKYLTLYKVMPYRIEVDEEKMVCTDFIFSDKEIVIYFKDIESLSGGIFDGRLRGVMKLCEGKNQICIGFSDKIKDSKKLMTLILSKVKKEVYNEVIEKLQALKKSKKK
ncbi:MAG TPA: hypothetical protein VK870_14500 [Ignavibacteriaceae bacterium]|nr:hypothetical protein [Ignavibacteriaceae bacterium]